MKKALICLILFLSFSSVTGCASPVKHSDPFFNINDDPLDPLLHLPLIKPIKVDGQVGSAPWRIFVPFGLWVQIPNRQDNSYYAYNIEDLEKFAVSNGVIMAYSAFVDQKADPYIRNNYYHWYVIIPVKKVAVGFQTESEFRQYIQALGIQAPDWQTPGEAYEQFKKTGCLEWIPDCK